jgi:Cu/Ag efflux protein CusF
MQHATVRVLLAQFAILMLFTAPAWAVSAKKAGNTHKGKVVEASGDKLTMTDMAGKNQHTHEITADTAVTCGGKKCDLSELKPGDVVTITTKKQGDNMVVTKVSKASTHHIAKTGAK